MLTKLVSLFRDYFSTLKIFSLNSIESPRFLGLKQPNLKKKLAKKPDLIIFMDTFHKKISLDRKINNGNSLGT